MKSIWEWLKKPKVWWFVNVLVMFAAELTGVILFLKFVGTGTWYSIFAYLLYALSAITLVYVIYCIVYFAPKIKASISDALQRREFTRKLVEQYGFRTIVFSIISVVINLAFVVYNGAMGIYYKSFWFGALGFYYLFLVTVRGGVVLSHHKNLKAVNDKSEPTEPRGVKTYIVCGVLLVLFPLVLSAIIWVMYATETVFVHSGHMIYLFAAYAFYKIIMSAYNYVKAQKEDELAVRAIRNVNLADALVSLFAL